MRSQKMLGTVMLLITALLWGCAFTAQSVGMNYVGPFTMQGVRLLIGSAVLTPFIALRGARARRGGVAETAEQRRLTLKAGLCCGVVLAVAVNTQQAGIQYTTVGKAAFVSAMYILLVPLFGLLLGRRTRPRMWFCVALGVFGMYLLCMSGGGFMLMKGDLLEFLGSMAFAVHIMTVDHFSDRVDGVKLSCLQFLTAGAITSVLMIALEHPSWQSVAAGWAPILYMGVMSCGVAYTFQVLGQKYVSPTAASLLMSMESVFSLLCGMVVLHEIPTVREALGCAVMLAAILLCQLPERKKGNG
ncbi:MAG: DMT family transporter [Clostridia bacterium]|nr:DMT family transporter [Clostridia bacterium]